MVSVARAGAPGSSAVHPCDTQPPPAQVSVHGSPVVGSRAQAPATHSLSSAQRRSAPGPASQSAPTVERGGVDREAPAGDAVTDPRLLEIES